jgi:hypothetical protein
MQRWSEFADEVKPLEGEKISITDVLNREIVVKSARISESKYKDRREDGRLVTMQIELEGKPHVLFTGSEVIAGQVQKYLDRMPFSATIVKVDRYYTFS